MVGGAESAQQHDEVLDDFSDLDDWMARIRPATQPPSAVAVLQMRLLIARHTDEAREMLAALDRRRSP